MQKTKYNTALIFLLLFAVSACSQRSIETVRSTTDGTVSNPTTTTSKKMADGIVGNQIGLGLDQRTRGAALAAEYKALETGKTGQPIAWQGSNGVYGQVIPQQSYQVGSQNCRRYAHTIHTNGQPEQATGTACRNSNGIWTPLT